MLLTIVVPTYNYAQFIPRLLTSITNQPEFLKDVKVIFVDDGSTDNTVQIINAYVKLYPSNILYYKKNNANWGSVINYVVKNRLVQTPYVTICDADDWYCRHAFKKVWPFLNRSNDLVIANFFKKHKYCILPIFVYFQFWCLRIENTLPIKQTPFCVPLGKFVKTDIFYNLPLLQENCFYQDAIYTMHLINFSQQIIYCKSFVGIYYLVKHANSMSRPWDTDRYRTELDVMNTLIAHDCQEIAAIHLLRWKFRRLVRTEGIKFLVRRKFDFRVFPLYVRLFYYLIWFFLLRKSFKFQPPNK